MKGVRNWVDHRPKMVLNMMNSRKLTWYWTLWYPPWSLIRKCRSSVWLVYAINHCKYPGQSVKQLLMRMLVSQFFYADNVLGWTLAVVKVVEYSCVHGARMPSPHLFLGNLSWDYVQPYLVHPYPVLCVFLGIIGGNFNRSERFSADTFGLRNN